MNVERKWWQCGCMRSEELGSGSGQGVGRRESKGAKNGCNYMACFNSGEGGGAILYPCPGSWTTLSQYWLGCNKVLKKWKDDFVYNKILLLKTIYHSVRVYIYLNTYVTYHYFKKNTFSTGILSIFWLALSLCHTKTNLMVRHSANRFISGTYNEEERSLYHVMWHALF